MRERMQYRPVKVDIETYERLRVLAAAGEQSMRRTIKVLVMRARPEDLGIVRQEVAPVPEVPHA